MSRLRPASMQRPQATAPHVVDVPRGGLVTARSPSVPSSQPNNVSSPTHTAVNHRPLRHADWSPVRKRGAGSRASMGGD